MSTVVIITRTSWDEPPRIRHEVARALSGYCKVLFVETPTEWRNKYETRIEEVEPNITRCLLSNRVALPVKIRHYIPFVHTLVDKILQKELNQVLERFSGEELILLNFNYDSIAVMRDASHFALKIYLCNDDFVGAVSNSLSRAIVKKRQIKVAAAANLCLATHTPLVEMLKKANSNTRLFLPGHDFKITDGRQPEKRQKNHKIRVCYMGFIDAALESAWLVHAAHQPDLEVHLIGPVEASNKDVGELINQKIFIHHGTKYGAALQQCLESMDVLVIPYDISLKRSQSMTAPNKLFKYLAAGKPVVISDMPNFIELGSSVVYRAFSKESFIEQIRAASGDDCDAFREKRLTIAAENTWLIRGRELWTIIKQASAKPLISIITPNYNYAGFIGETIESVVSQDYGNIEHILVDDGSTDNSVEIIREYVQRYPEMVRLVTQANAGQTAAVNAGLKIARGAIIGWLNSDDTYCPGAFRRAVEQFQLDPDLDIVYGDFNVIDPEGRLIYRFKKIRFNYFIASMQGFGVILTSNSMFWRARVMQQSGLLDESFQYAMDCEFFSRLTRKTRMKKINLTLANWRHHPQAKTVVYHNEKDQRYDAEVKGLLNRYYDSLSLSRVIPQRFAGLPRMAVRLTVAVMKIINGNYFVRAANLYRYNQVTGKK